LRIADSRSFVEQVVGSQLRADSSRVDEYFGGQIVQHLSDALARFFVEQGVSIFEANAKLNELSRFTTEQISPEFARFGIEIVYLNVENINLPDDEKRKFQDILGRRMEIEQISEAQVGQAYVTMRSFDVLEKVAENSGGAAGGLLAGGVGLGMGLAGGVSAGQQIGSAINITSQEAKPADDMVTRLQQLKRMLDAGLITEKEFDTKKQQILDSI
jgi:membrane protease subunit (stomatin/prohibitin family)